MNGINIKIGAEVNGAITGLQQVQAQMAKTGQSSQAMTTQLAKVPQTSNAATQSLINLSRVAQDAPFGFIGIANNLNPLLESFQRLKASAGSTGGALKALGSSLVGAGGIGLAIGVVSSLLVVFGDRLFGTKKKAEETKKELENLDDSIAKIGAESASKSVAQLKTLEVAITSLSTPLKNRKDALDEYNKVADKNNQIQVEDINNINLVNTAISNQIKLIEKRALVRAAEGKLAEFFKIIFESEFKIDNAVQKTNKSLEKQKITSEDLVNSFSSGNVDEFTKSIERTNKASAQLGLSGLKQLEFSAKKAREQVSLLLDFIKLKISEGNSFGSIFGQLNLKPDKVELDKQKSRIAIEEQLDELQRNIPFKFNIKTGLLEFAPPELSEVQKAFEKAQEGLRKIKPKDTNVKPPKNIIDPVLLKEQLINNINDAFAGFSSDTFSAIGESLANALSGADIGRSLLDSLSGLLSALGKALIQYGIIKEGFDKLFGIGGILIPGAVAIGLGVLAVAASKALKNIPGRATGGPIQAGRAYIVGERGPEVILPNQSGTVIPNNQLGGLRGPGVNFGGGEVIFKIGGNELVGVLSRTNQSQRRLT